MPDESPQLALARRWAVQLGNTVEPVQATDAQGDAVAAFGVRHGPIQLIILETPTGVLTVLAVITIPPELRQTIGRLPPEFQAKMQETLKLAFMDCPRVGWNLIPPTATLIGMVERFDLSENLRIVDSDVASFNRFADAIQEVVTLAVRGQQVYSTVFVGGPGPPSRATSPHDTQIYR